MLFLPGQWKGIMHQGVWNDSLSWSSKVLLYMSQCNCWVLRFMPETYMMKCIMVWQLYQRQVFLQKKVNQSIWYLKKSSAFSFVDHVESTCVWHSTTVLCLLTSKLHTIAWYSSQLLLLICSNVWYNCLMNKLILSLGFLLPLHYVIICRQVEILEAVQGMCRTVNIAHRPNSNWHADRVPGACWLLHAH